MSAVSLSASRLLAVVGLTLAGGVSFPIAGLLPWLWIRECGALSAIHAIAFFAPSVASVVVLDAWTLTGRLTVARTLRVVALAVASEWILGLVFFSTQWGC